MAVQTYLKGVLVGKRKKYNFEDSFRKSLTIGSEEETAITDSQLKKMWKHAKREIALTSTIKGNLTSFGLVLTGVAVAKVTGDTDLASELLDGTTGVYALIGSAIPITLIFNGFSRSKVYKNPSLALALVSSRFAPSSLSGYREFVIKERMKNKNADIKSLTFGHYMEWKVKENLALESRNAAMQKSLEKTKDSLKATPKELDKKIKRPTSPLPTSVKSPMVINATHEDVKNKIHGYSAVFSVLSNVKSEWFEWENDILRVVKYPSLFDLNESSTLNFHKALAYAESIAPEKDSAYDVTHPFNRAVSDVKIAWQAAVANAERVRLARFDVNEKARLIKALDLLNIALNKASAPAERQSAYKRAMSQLEGLVVVPNPVLNALEGFAHYGELLGDNTGIAR